MRIWREGEVTQGICPRCEQRRRLRYTRRDLTEEEVQVPASSVLVAVCEACDTVALIPEQSMPRIRAAGHRRTKTLNARVPGHLVDILGLLADIDAPGAPSGAASVLRMLLHAFGTDPAFARRVASRHPDHPLVKGSVDEEISLRVPVTTLLAADDMASREGIPTRSDLIRALLATAKEEILDGTDPELAATVRRGLSAVP